MKPCWGMKDSSSVPHWLCWASQKSILAEANSRLFYSALQHYHALHYSLKWSPWRTAGVFLLHCTPYWELHCVCVDDAFWFFKLFMGCTVTLWHTMQCICCWRILVPGATGFVGWITLAAAQHIFRPLFIAIFIFMILSKHLEQLHFLSLRFIHSFLKSFHVPVWGLNDNANPVYQETYHINVLHSLPPLILLTNQLCSSVIQIDWRETGVDRLLRWPLSLVFIWWTSMPHHQDNKGPSTSVFHP